jgi:PAS domain S-box-containing protein
LSRWRAYTAAVLIFGIALGLRLTFLPVHVGIPYITFFPAVVLALMFLGTGPGMVVAALGAGTALWLIDVAGFEESRTALRVIATVCFLATCGAIALMQRALARRQAELETALSEAVAAKRRVEQMLTQTPAMIHSVDPQGRLIAVSDLWLTKLGYTREEVIGRRSTDFLTAASQQRALGEVFPRFYAEGRVENVEYQMVCKDGSIIDVLLSAMLERDAAGQAGNSFTVTFDVTARMQMERTLAESESRYRLLVEDQTEMISLSQLDGTLTFVNLAYARLFGTLPRAMIGMNLYSHIPPAQRATVRKRRRDVSERGLTVAGNNHLVLPDGESRWIAWTNRPLLDSAGKIIGIHGVGRDMTAHKVLEDRLASTLRDVRELYDEAPCGYHSVGPDGRYLNINATELRWLGCTRAEAIGERGPADFLSEADGQLLAASFHHVRTTGVAASIDLTLLGRDAPTRIVTIGMSPVYDDYGTFLMCRSVMFDITEQAAARRALQNSQALLARISDVAGVGGWSLDLRTGTLSCSDQACRLIGLAPGIQPTLDELLGFYAPESRAEVRRHIDAASTEGRGFDLQVRFLRIDGRSIWVRLVCTVEHAGEHPVHLLGAFHDVTATVQHQRRIENLLAVSEAQRAELVAFRDRAESEADLASFLLSRLTRTEQLDDPGVRFHWVPAETFSGDVIAAARSNTGELYGMLADATGHGLAAAINLIPLTSAFYAMAAKGFNLATIADQLNKVVKDYSLSDRFVAVTLARFSSRDRQLEVLNAGNPAAMLLDSTRQTLREFHSGSVPLGILPRSQFEPVVETVELHGGEELLMFSDGLVEACDWRGVPFGRARLEGALRDGHGAEDTVAWIRAGLARHLADIPPADDISLLVLRDVATGAGIDSTPVVPSPPKSGGPGDSVDTGGQGCWRVETSLSSSELQKLEVVPVIVGLTRTFGLRHDVEARLFTILSELFVNALEHGLLQLDSRIKHQSGGFDAFFELRAERLAALQSGSVSIQVEHTAFGADQGHLRITVRDSGSGFDHRTLSAAADAGTASPVPCGRGLALLRSLADTVAFNDAGNIATVSFAYG